MSVNVWWGLFHPHDGHVAVMFNRPMLYVTRAAAQTEQRLRPDLRLRLRRVNLILPDAPPTRRRRMP